MLSLLMSVEELQRAYLGTAVLHQEISFRVSEMTSAKRTYQVTAFAILCFDLGKTWCGLLCLI